MIWALASLGDPSVTDVIASMYGSEDPGVRKMAVYALGGLGTEDLSVLRGALDDPIPDVQWNAAVALARQGGSDGMTVLRRMLDRDYVERTVTRVARVDATLDPVSEVMISGLQAVAALRSTEMRDTVTSLIENDVSLNVREVAMRTLELLDSDVTETSDVVRYER